MIRRAVAGVLALLTLLNGVSMLVDTGGWFGRVPGVVETGPFNPHFVRDVGFGFMTAGGALAAFAWRRGLWPAALAGSAFLALHALFHLFEMAMGRSHHVGAELLLVVLPAALAVAVSWPTNGVLDA